VAYAKQAAVHHSLPNDRRFHMQIRRGISGAPLGVESERLLFGGGEGAPGHAVHDAIHAAGHDPLPNKD